MRQRAGRILFLVMAFLALATIAPSPPRRPPPAPGGSVLLATPIALDPAHPERRRAGALLFRRGWHLTSPDWRFGGLSAIHVDSGKIVALSDSGVVMEFDLPSAATAVRQPVRFTPLAGPGPATRKSNRDTESLVVLGGQAWVAFERHNMIWRYRRSDWHAQSAARPAAMRTWRRNGGAEALVRLPDGRFLAIAEGDDEGPFSEVVIFTDDPAASGTLSRSYRYRRLAGFLPTEAALLPDHRLLVLNRSITLLGGMAAKLAIVDLAGLRPGGILESREIAELRSPLAVDNMEALSIVRENNRTVVRIASDDNFIRLQRTLLLEFELDERALRP